jgi:hypothetical protein
VRLFTIQFSTSEKFKSRALDIDAAEKWALAAKKRLGA